VQKIGAFGNTETLAAIVTDRQHTNKIKVMVWLKCLTEHVCIHGISDKFGIMLLISSIANPQLPGGNTL
jgi:hypothetical protein